MKHPYSKLNCASLRRLACVLAACLGLAAQAAAETATLVKDINQTAEKEGSAPSNMADVNGVIYFAAATSEYGIELWKSDGTAKGSVLVKDIRAGTGGSNPSGLVNVNGTLFFYASDTAHRYGLWKSDGTAEGTVLVKTIWEGSPDPMPSELTNVNGTLFFRGFNPASGVELWKSDGTPEGTVMVKDITPGSGDSSPSYLVDINGTLFFTASDDVAGVELWKSDGTPGGTVIVKDIAPGSRSSSPSYLVHVSGTLFFTANDGVAGYELWRSDGTEVGTVMVKDTRDGSTGAYPHSLVDVNGILFFATTDSGSGPALWKSDGTEGGTVMVRAIPAQHRYSLTSLVNVGGTLFFTATDDITGSELWRSDGTPAGTAMIKDIVKGPGGSFPSNLVNVNGILFFTAHEEAFGHELWKSDGTSEGTTRVSDIWLGNSSSSPSNPLPVNGVLYFRANNGIFGAELWKSDGTPRGTLMVKNIQTSGGSSYPSNSVDVDGTLFFSASDGVHGTELWKSDGTNEGTLMVKDIRPGSGLQAPSSDISNLLNVNGTLFFCASDGVHGAELWKSDGSYEGTVMVKDIRPGIGDSFPFNLVNVDGTLFFVVHAAPLHSELWKSDGTPDGTVRVKGLNPGGTSYVSNLVNVNGTLFFTASTSTSGQELWKSDGTPEGTVMVKDIVPGWQGSQPSNLVSNEGVLYLTAAGGIWKSDGTNDGTLRISSPPSWISGFVIHNNQLFFTASDQIHGSELWKSDVNETDTVMVKDIRPGSQGSSPSKFAIYNGMLFFTVIDHRNGHELWKTDGTEEGTVLVKRFLSRIDGRRGYNQQDDYPPESDLVVFNGRLYFNATGDSAGEELWRSDGTPEGTVLAADLFPGEASSDPYSFVVGSQLFVTARHPELGVELFVISETPPFTSRGSIKALRPAEVSISVTVAASGAPTNVHIEYGISPSLGMSTAVQSTDGMSEQTLSFTLEGLKLSTRYYYRVVATNSAGTSYGEVSTFTTTNIASVPVESGTPAPGAGEPDGPPAGTVIRRFGVPAISDTRKIAAKVTLASGRKLLEGIYVKEDDGSTALPAVQNGAIPGVEGGTFKSFLDPQLSPDGALGFIAKIKGPGISVSNDEGLWSVVFGSGLEPVLREGSEVPGTAGARLKAVPSFSLRDGEVLASVTLARGRGGVTPLNDTALLRIGPSGTKVLLREGDPFVLGTDSPSKITQISVLSPAAGSPGHGRWHAGDGQGVAKITLANKKQVVVRWNAEGDIAPMLTTGSEAAGAQWSKLGLPSIGTDGSGVVTYGQLETGKDGVAKRDEAALVYSPSNAASQVIAREGMDVTEMEGVTFGAFLDPVCGSSREFAFVATLKGSAINRFNQSSLWWGTADGIELVAQQSATATDENGVSVPGRVWASFVSYALPSGAGAGPIFVAKVRGEEVNASNNMGLWAVDSNGLIRELVRTGAEVETEAGLKTLESFRLLTATPGSFGATRSFNATGAVVLQAIFEDKSQAIVRFDLP